MGNSELRENFLGENIYMPAYMPQNNLNVKVNHDPLSISEEFFKTIVSDMKVNYKHIHVKFS